MICFGSGVPGGIFLPMLVLGSLGGAIFAKLAVLAGIMEPQWTVNCIVFGMTAYFSAVVKSPVTGAILIMEMTGSFEHLLALIIVSMTAYLLADILNGEPVYDMLLNRSLALQKKITDAIRHRRLMTELVVKAGSRIADNKVDAIAWPVNSILVNVRRGDFEITPQADLTLKAGDYLYVLIDDNKKLELMSLNKELPA